MRMVCRTLALLLATTAVAGAARAALPRFPNMRNGQIVFEADGNLWQVASTGGTAHKLTSDPGQDMMPRFSPDGKWIAFTASYQGNEDVYVIPAAGGAAKRLTFQSDLFEKTGGRHGPDNMVVTWTPDSQNIVFMSRRMAWNSWISRFYTVPVTGGLPVALPVDSAGLMTYGPDGHSIAYNRIFRNFRTWKRYEGGLAQQVFTYDFATKTLNQITDWKGTNTAPMWYGNKIYYLSDNGKNWRQNIWVYDLATKSRRQITDFSDYDIDFPSLGDAGISFQQGGKLYVIDLPSEKLRQIDVTIQDDGTRTQPRVASVKALVRDTDMAQQVDYALSPNGKRALFSARGDIFSVPAEDGATRNLTNTQGADEDHPAWSPDGTTIAYTTDSTGNPQVATRPALGGAEKILTHFQKGYFYGPVFSPDGKQLAFSDSEHRLWLVAANGGSAPKQVAQNAFGEIHDQSFSPDSKYLTYSLNRDAQQHALWIYDIAAGHAVQVSTPGNDDQNPVFSPDGKYLYFLSSRHENPAISDTEFNFATLKSQGIYVAPLARDGASPFAPKSDEGAIEEAKKDDSAKKDADSAKSGKDQKAAAPKPVHIDFDGLTARAVAVPVPPGNIVTLDVRADKLIYGTQPLPLLEGNLPGEKSALHIYDLDKRRDGVADTGLDSYSLSADGKKLLVKEDHDYALIDAAPTPGGGGDSKDGDKKPLNLDGLRAHIDPISEWSELFDNAWRLERDFFYSPVMNGVDWQQVHDAYRKLLPLAGSREDVNYLIGQALGEMSNSHTYVGDGDDGDPTEPVRTAVLGADYALDQASGRYTFATIYPGDNTRAAYRSPLTEPGIGIKQGDFLLAINGTELKAPATPYSLMVGISPADPVTLTVASSATGKRRDVVVKPLANELSVREKAWIDHNRETVDKLSGGRVAYIYLSNMEMLGMQQFIRQFYSQLDKQAVIVDDRWNGGGFIDQMVLERLRRVLVGLGTNRERSIGETPNQLILGPKICLINHYSASDGDIFPYYFKQYGLGKLLGTRTWGGVRGIRGEWRMMDGGYVTIPEDALYDLAGTWVLENHGVEPDIELDDLPGELADGHDKQLETAVGLLTKELDAHPVKVAPPPPLLPAYPANGIVPGPSK
jgi:tricorn protease